MPSFASPTPPCSFPSPAAAFLESALVSTSKRRCWFWDELLQINSLHSAGSCSGSTHGTIFIYFSIQNKAKTASRTLTTYEVQLQETQQDLTVWPRASKHGAVAYGKERPRLSVNTKKTNVLLAAEMWDHDVLTRIGRRKEPTQRLFWGELCEKKRQV